MSDIVNAASQTAPMTRTRRIVFMAAVALTLVCGLLVILSPSAAGVAGLALVVGLTIAALFMLFVLVDREPGVLWPGRGVGGAVNHRKDLISAASAFDAMRDPAMITTPRGTPRAANRSFRTLAQSAGVMGSHSPLPDFERLLGGHPLTSQAIYRLDQAARRGERRRERLPATQIGPEGERRAYDVEVSPMPYGEALWVATPLEGDGGDHNAPNNPLLDEAPIGYFSAAPDGSIIYMNETLRDWIGETAEKADLRLQDFVGAKWTKVLERSGRTSVATAEVPLKARDGIDTRAVIHTHWPETGGRPMSRSVVFGVQGASAPVGLALSAPHATPSSATLDAMFENAPFGVARLDREDFANALIHDANPSLLRMTQGGAAPGARFADLFRMDDEAVARLAEATIQSGAPVELSFPPDPSAGEGRRKEGREVHVYFAQDRAERVAAFVIDVAQYKEIERQFTRVSKAQSVGGLARVVAHDINNYLNRIGLAADTLLEAHPVGDPSYEHLQKIKQNVLRGGGLMRQLLAFSSQETTQAVPIELSELMTGFDDLLRSGLSEKVTLKVQHARDVPVIKVDRGQIENVIMNLVTNARDAIIDSKGDGDITIKTTTAIRDDLVARGVMNTTADDYAVVEIADNGSGMSEATMKRIFEPFYTTKAEGKGTGLGLATAFGVLEQAGGHILVDSELTVGTTFRLYLPAYVPNEAERAELKAAAEAREETPSDQAGEGRILFVEDDNELRTLAANLLKKRGYDVVQAEDGLEALEILEDDPGKFILLISDVVMPEVDGPTLLKKGREYLGSARVLFVSGYAEQNLSDTLSEDRDISFLPKPYSVHELAERVKGLLGR